MWEDWDILNELVEKGYDIKLSWYVIGLVPIVIGRELLNQLGVEISPEIVFYNSLGKIYRTLLIDHFSVYKVIQKRLDDIRNHENIKNIIMHSTEVHCVNQMMNNGSNPKDLILTAPGLIDPI